MSPTFDSQSQCADNELTGSETAVPNGPDLNRVASMMASGEIPLKFALFNQTEQAFLIGEIHRRRRQRLVHFIARAIANAIDSA